MDLHFWVVPDGGTLMLSLSNLKGETISIDITQSIDLEIDPDILLPGRMYINEKLIELKSSEETELLLLLKKLITDQKLGHPQGLAAILTKKSILFFNLKKQNRCIKL